MFEVFLCFVVVKMVLIVHGEQKYMLQVIKFQLSTPLIST